MIRSALAVAALAVLATPALADPAQNGPWQTGLSLLGPAKYAADFKHFDYVNPDAPKGGLVRVNAYGSFDTFNTFLPQGTPADGIGLVYETLMNAALDDPQSSYPALANAVAYPPDISSVTFRLNPKAKWQDGQPVTPDDVKWSFEQITKINPNYAQYFQEVSKVEVTAPDQVTFYANTNGNRELPVILGQVTVLPKHWFEAKDANGKQRDIGSSSLEPPMGSGPYKMSSFSAGQSITYSRDPNYWGIAEPSAIGENNFDTIRYEYFRDPDVAFEGFKGDQFDWWEENKARRWANEYTFPAVQQKKVVQELFPEDMASEGDMVAFIPNLRLDKFKDERVRRAINDAFDFETLSKTLFYGQYARIDSYFFGLPFAAKDLPQGKELEILNSVKDKVPASVFTTPYANPVAGDPTKLRANLKDAIALFTAAGYHLDGNTMVDANGTPFTFELLLNSPAIEPVAQSLQTNLKSIGVDMQIHEADTSEYTDRIRNRKFEMTYSGWAESLSPGNEQFAFFGSKSADDPNSSNYAGIADPGIDALIDQLVHAPDRDTVLATASALDRVLLAHNYVIPSYSLRNARVARWDRFSHPDTLPEFSIGFPTIWWYDEAKAAVTGPAKN